MRARSIKPGFFANEELAELPYEYRILYEGLWCLADRDGRLEDRPRRIKAQVFPYDGVDVDLGLSQLAQHRFIIRYVISGQPIIWIPTFLDHQSPHSRETASTLPEHNPSTTEDVPGHDPGRARTDTPEQVEDDSESSCSEGAFIMSTTKAVPKHDQGDAEHLLARAPLRVESAVRSQESESQESGVRSQDGGSARARAEIVVTIFHELCPELPRVSELTEARKRRSLALLKRLGDQGTRDFFAKVAASDFLMGLRPGRDWRADFDWLIKPEHVPKILEGSYDTRNGNGRKPANVAAALELVQRCEAEEATRVAH